MGRIRSSVVRPIWESATFGERDRTPRLAIEKEVSCLAKGKECHVWRGKRMACLARDMILPCEARKKISTFRKSKRMPRLEERRRNATFGKKLLERIEILLLCNDEIVTSARGGILKRGRDPDF